MYHKKKKTRKKRG